MLKKLVPAVRIAACDSKSCSESRLWTWKLPIPKAVPEYTLEKINQWNYEREGKPEQKFDAALELELIKSLELLSVFKEESRTF